MEKKSTFQTWVSIVGILYLGILIFLGFWIFKPRPIVNEVTLQIQMPTDSVAAKLVLENTLHTLQELSSTIDSQEKELHNYYELLLKARQDDADIIKILTVIGAMIVAIGSFFGIRNLKDFKDGVAAEAQATAAAKVDKITKGSLKSTVTEQFRKTFSNNEVYLDMKERIQAEVVSTFIISLQEEVKELTEKVEKLSRQNRTEEDSDGNEVQTDSQNNQDEASLTDIDEDNSFSSLPDVPSDL